MSKHTPGPWVIDCGQDNHGFYYYELHASPEQPKWEAEANARLIAAAPELQACKQMLHEGLVGIGTRHAFDEHYIEQVRVALSMMRAAIAKAEERS
jgi:hypothetical protein